MEAPEGRKPRGVGVNPHTRQRLNSPLVRIDLLTISNHKSFKAGDFHGLSKANRGVNLATNE